MIFIQVFIWAIFTHYSACEFIDYCNCKANPYDSNVPDDPFQRIDFRKYIQVSVCCLVIIAKKFSLL